MFNIDTIVLWIIMFFVGYAAGYLYRTYLNRNPIWHAGNDGAGSGLDVDFISSLPYHIKPKYHGYRGGYANVSVCGTCGRTALYEDQHPVDPCPECGDSVYDTVTSPPPDYVKKIRAKWVSDVWVFSKDSWDPCLISVAYRNSRYYDSTFSEEPVDARTHPVPSDRLIREDTHKLPVVDIDSKIT